MFIVSTLKQRPIHRLLRSVIRVHKSNMCFVWDFSHRDGLGQILKEWSLHI